MTKYIFFNSRDELLRIEIGKVVCFEADGNYTNIILANKLKCTVPLNLTQTAKVLEDSLKKEAMQFVRLGKKCIVNIEYVYRINVLKQTLVLSDFSEFIYQVNMSREAAKKLKEVIVQLKR